jgi:hypothetical protein
MINEVGPPDESPNKALNVPDVSAKEFASQDGRSP